MHPLRPVRRLASSLLLTLALGATAAGAVDDRLPLAAVDYDTIWTTNGGQTVGTITGTQADGAVRIDRIGLPSTLVPRGEILRIDRKQNLAEAVARRGDQALAADDQIDLTRILRFALDKQPEPKPEKSDPKKPPADIPAVKDAAIALAQKALAKKPTTEVAGLALALLWEKQDHDGVLAVARLGLRTDPNWTPGYEYQARVLLLRKQDEPMRALVKAWLERQPTAFQANRYMAGLAEAGGDLRTAAEAYRKGFDLHQDWESALGYARCSLKRGDAAECVRACTALLGKAGEPAVAPLVPAARAWLGSAQLAQNAPEAQATLEAALAGTLDDETADIARYNLGLIHARAGRADEARKQWRQVKGPMGAVALAQIDRKKVPALPPGLGQFGAEHNAAIELEAGRWQGVAIDPSASRRAVFLSQIAALLKSNGGDEALHNLAATPGDESLRWQAYGRMLQNRFKDAEGLLDQLPVTDGWAIAARVYIAATRKDEAAAQSWLKRLDGASGVPKQYAQVLVAEFASANDEVASESFDWPDPDAPATGWEVANPGTGIAVAARGGKLVLDGTQTGEAPTCAYKLVLAERLRAATVTLDTLKLGAGTGGLELTDDRRENGVEVGINAGRVVWRSAEKGVWGAWSDAGLPAVAGEAGLRIELDKGRLSAALAGDPTNRVLLAGGLGRGERLAVGIFGVAAAGTPWTLVADDLVVQLRPVAKR